MEEREEVWGRGVGVGLRRSFEGLFPHALRRNHIALFASPRRSAGTVFSQFTKPNLHSDLLLPSDFR